MSAAELLGRTLMLPLGLFIASLEAMLQTVRRATETTTNPGVREDAALPQAREATMSDMSLSDDMVKLVRFTIVNIERDREKILAKDEEIVTDSMTDDAFASWMISKHVKPHGGSGDDDPRKYLRVSYEVVSRWPKQDRKYEKRQLEVLEGIREAIEKRN